MQDLQAVIPVVERCAQEFVSDLLSTLRERQLELRTAPVVFVGGGSILPKWHIGESVKDKTSGSSSLYSISEFSTTTVIAQEYKTALLHGDRTLDALMANGMPVREDSVERSGWLCQSHKTFTT